MRMHVTLTFAIVTGRRTKQKCHVAHNYNSRCSKRDFLCQTKPSTVAPPPPSAPPPSNPSPTMKISGAALLFLAFEGATAFLGQAPAPTFTKLNSSPESYSYSYGGNTVRDGSSNSNGSTSSSTDGTRVVSVVCRLSYSPSPRSSYTISPLGCTFPHFTESPREGLGNAPGFLVAAGEGLGAPSRGRRALVWNPRCPPRQFGWCQEHQRDLGNFQANHGTRWIPPHLVIRQPGN